MAGSGSTDLRRFASSGDFRGVLRTGARGEVIGLRTGPERTVWLLTDDGGRLRIYRGGHRRPFAPPPSTNWPRRLPPSALTAADEDGFCLTANGPDGPETTCHTWQGLPRDPAPPATDAYVTSGSYVTALIDSGISRCRWHRVRVDADVPAGTAVAARIVVSEDGRYEESDWQASAPGATDFLVDQPPGRFLRLRLRLSGDGACDSGAYAGSGSTSPGSPAPTCCRPPSEQDPAADDFTERFLSLFDATLAQLDRVIERYPALLDPAGVPDRVLPWLAGLLGLSFEAGWDARTRRALLAAAPELYRRRGTPWALREAVRIVFGVAPVIDELAADRRWAHLREAAGGSDGAGAAAAAQGLGASAAVRQVGEPVPGRRLGAGRGAAARVRRPDSDPFTAHAHRFRAAPARRIGGRGGAATAGGAAGARAHGGVGTHRRRGVRGRFAVDGRRGHRVRPAAGARAGRRTPRAAEPRRGAEAGTERVAPRGGRGSRLRRRHAYASVVRGRGDDRDRAIEGRRSSTRHRCAGCGTSTARCWARGTSSVNRSTTARSRDCACAVCSATAWCAACTWNRCRGTRTTARRTSAEESARARRRARKRSRAAREPERTRRRAKVRITPGLAVDCDGNEVVVRGGCVIDLWKALPPHERDTDTVWVGIEYAERPVEPTRAVYNDACADTSDCEFGWTEECYRVRVTGCEPPVDERCDTCCSRLLSTRCCGWPGSTAWTGTSRCAATRSI